MEWRSKNELIRVTFGLKGKHLSRSMHALRSVLVEENTEMRCVMYFMGVVITLSGNNNFCKEQRIIYKLLRVLDERTYLCFVFRDE